MRRCREILVAGFVCWLVVLPPASADEAYLPALSDCLLLLSHMPAGEQVRLADSCPDQMDVLTADAAPVMLAHDPSGPLRVGTLRRVGELLLDADGVAHYHLDRESLDRILRDLDLHREDRETPWQRFVAWLDDQFPSLEDLRPQWLDRALDSVLGDHQGWKWLGFALLIGLVVLLLWALLRILANAFPGLSWPWFSAAATSSGGAGPLAADTLAAIRRLSPARQPAALLVHCIVTLRQAGTLPSRRGLTNGECRKLLQQRSAEQGEVFRGLCELVERSVYGGQALTGDELAACFFATARLTGEDTR